jgi:site-specific DNA-cytosine methylase
MGTGGNNVPIVMRQREGKPGGGKGPLLSEDSLTLATRNDQYLFQPVPFVKARRAKSVEDHETWVEGEVSPTLNLFDNGGEARATVLIPYTDIVGTLTVSGLEKGQTNGSTADTGVLQVYGISGMVIGRKDENGPNGISVTEEGGPMFTLTTIDRHAVATPYAVRRLLPIECERLMGWPDDWTRWDAEGKEQTDGHRYKQSGNGVASPVAEWVGRQIFAADAMSKL